MPRIRLRNAPGRSAGGQVSKSMRTGCEAKVGSLGPGNQDRQAFLEAQISAIRQGGQPLPRAERTFFEPRFGRDLGSVRIHTSGGAAESARRLNARAYTLGQSIVFGPQQYAPGSLEGRLLLAHELAHVFQPGGRAAIRRMDYQVSSGDSLSRIARRFHTTVQELKRRNRLRSDAIQAGQTLHVPDLAGCSITLPENADTRALGGAIFAEAVATLTANTEREAIGWVFLNRVRHVNELCTGKKCPKLREQARKAQCAIDRRNFGGTMASSLRIGSTAFGNSRWNLVMSGTTLRPLGNICLALTAPGQPGEVAAFQRAMKAAEAVKSGNAPHRDYVGMNQDPNKPPSRKRMEKAAVHGVHTFYSFISGRECG